MSRWIRAKVFPRPGFVPGQAGSLSPQDRAETVVGLPRDKVMFFAGSMSSPRDHVNDGTGRGGAYVYYGNDTRYLIAAKV